MENLGGSGGGSRRDLLYGRKMMAESELKGESLVLDTGESVTIYIGDDKNIHIGCVTVTRAGWELLKKKVEAEILG